MTSSNLKNLNTSKEVKKSLSQKDSHFIEFNKKLEDFISDIKPKSSPTETNLKENSDSPKSSKKPHNPVQANNISNQEKNSSLNAIQVNNNNSAIYSKALCRINFGKLMDCDQFAENYILEPYMILIVIMIMILKSRIQNHLKIICLSKMKAYFSCVKKIPKINF